MADSKFGLRSLIARDGEAIYGSLETAGAGASIQPIAPMLAGPYLLDTVPKAVPGQELANVGAQLTQLVTGQTRLIDTLERFNGSLLDVMGALKTGKGNSKGGASSDTVKPSQALETAMTDLHEVVGFAGHERTQLREANLALASDPMVAASGADAVDLARVEQVGARSGVGKDLETRQADLLQFARDSALIAAAFQTDIKTAGEMMGGWRGSMKLDRPQALDLADATNVLGSHASLKADAVDIGSIVRQSTAARTSGMSPEQVAAFSAALLTVGNNRASAGLAVEKVGAALAKGDGASEGQRAAWAELNLDPKVLAAGMKQDAPQTVLTVLEALKAQPQERQAALATQLFDGNRSILSLVPVIDTLKQAFTAVADKSTYATSVLGDQGSVMRSATGRADSTQAHEQAFQASTTRLETASDTAIAPLKNGALTVLTSVVNGLGWLAESLPKATAALTLAAVVMVPLAKKLGGTVVDKVFDKVAGKVLGEGDAPRDAGGNKPDPSGSKGKSQGNDTRQGERTPGKKSGPDAPTKTNRASRIAKRGSLALVVADAGVNLIKGASNGTLKESVGASVGSIGGGVAGGVAGEVAGLAIGRAVGTLAGAALGSIIPGAGTVLGGVIGGFAGGAIGKVVGGVVGTFVGSDVGASLGEKVMSSDDRLPPPEQVSQSLPNAQTDNRQINFAPQINITAPEQTSYQALAALVVQQIEAQFTPLSMDNLLATRRDAALTDGAV
ncbi:phage tail tape measure protein [Pseudomonas sp. Colony2]|uniref:phage tail tape measure protein n=1 Tax=Pseudomonas sp. Colony2 TaxID=2861799 RepID=UPI001C5D860D|nr:phage tail tape measure protein [Pseudomonas sp. Colony2]